MVALVILICMSCQWFSSRDGRLLMELLMAEVGCLPHSLAGSVLAQSAAAHQVFT